MPIKHAFTSPKGDSGDPDVVGPDEWNAVHVGGPAGSSGDVDISGTTPVSVGSSVVSLAAGDTVRAELFGYVRNATGGTRTISLGIMVGSTTYLEVAGSATVATNTDTPVFLTGYIGVRSTSLCYFAATGAMNPVAAAGASASSVSRSAWQSTAANLTGSQTIHVTGRGSAAGAGLDIRVAGYRIEKI